MKRWSSPFMMGVLTVASIAAITHGLAADPVVRVFPDFVEVRSLVSDMQSKVPLNREWSLVYCECKNGKVVAIPVYGSATEIDRALCEQKSRDHGGCKLEARIMKIRPSENRLDTYRKREETAKKQRELDEERYRLWRSQPSSTAGDSGSGGASETHWMSKEDYERHKEREAAEAAAAERRVRKQRVDRLKDAAKEKIYRRILGEPEYLQPYNPDQR